MKSRTFDEVIDDYDSMTTGKANRKMKAMSEEDQQRVITDAREYASANGQDTYISRFRAQMARLARREKDDRAAERERQKAEREEQQRLAREAKQEEQEQLRAERERQKSQREAEKLSERERKQAEKEYKKITDKVIKKIDKPVAKVKKVKAEKVETLPAKYTGSAVTRSERLRAIEQAAYETVQNNRETRKRDKEDVKAARRGARRGMSTFDAAVDRVAEITETKRALEQKITDVREKINPGSTTAEKKYKPNTTKAQLKRIAKSGAVNLKRQQSRSWKQLQPTKATPFKARRDGAPFAITKDLSGLNTKKPASFGVRSYGNPFAVTQPSFGFLKKSQSSPFAVKKTKIRRI